MATAWTAWASVTLGWHNSQQTLMLSLLSMLLNAGGMLDAG
jgi:hypothetical protein